MLCIADLYRPIQAIRILFLPDVRTDGMFGLLVQKTVRDVIQETVKEYYPVSAINVCRLCADRICGFFPIPGT